ncbi:MAG: ABC transporter permease [Chitinophagaceae bacterium]|nr:ABC transporter permease [Chitinophagaceae bacterium]
MFSFIIKKLGYGILVMFGVVVIVFFLFQGFGDPSRLIIGQTGDSTTIKNIRKELALDQPKWKQFTMYLNDISPLGFYSKAERKEKNIKGYFVGNVGVKLPYLRRSYQTRKNVSAILSEAIPQTIVLAFAAMFIAIIFGIALGVVAALKQNTWLDTGSIFTSVLGISAPSFFMGIVIAYLFGFVLNNYTNLPLTGSLYEIDAFNGKQLQLKNLILPAITLGIRPMAIITQITRSAMLDVLNQDYIRTAYAKGLSTKMVVWKHALKNALNPVITSITGWFAELLAGAFFVEYIFGWNGIGKLTVMALENLDFPVVMGSVLLTASFFILVNIIADLLYSYIDPRIKLS